MDLIQFIETKKSGKAHRPDEIAQFIRLLVAGDVPDYQASAWLMAVNFNGLDPDETVALTEAIVESGETASYEGFPGPVVDKHSTGGVGDKVTLVLLPILAEMGMYVPKHSGRALGFTGGTTDKLESIPGFDAFPPEERFRNIVREIGFAVGGQGGSMCPADGILYALRDATSTVNETGLIAASVVSKKIAGGAKHILIDVKVGRGAFMRDEASAKKLAERMVYVGNGLGRNTRCILTKMNQPLGRAMGNALELRETVDCLRGRGPVDVMEVCRAIAVELAVMSSLSDEKSARAKFNRIVSTGSALDRFTRFVVAQGGKADWIDGDGELPPASRIIELHYNGPYAYVTSIDALGVGEIVRRMGGGRLSKEDAIDHSVGVLLERKVGDAVTEGDTLALLHLNTDSPDIDWPEELRAKYSFDDNPPVVGSMIIGKVPAT